jgi:hypothetical protein
LALLKWGSDFQNWGAARLPPPSSGARSGGGAAQSSPSHFVKGGARIGRGGFAGTRDYGSLPRIGRTAVRDGRCRRGRSLRLAAIKDRQRGGHRGVLGPRQVRPVGQVAGCASTRHRPGLVSDMTRSIGAPWWRRNQPSPSRRQARSRRPVTRRRAGFPVIMEAIDHAASACFACQSATGPH